MVVISGVISPLIRVISIVSLLLTPLLTTHEPPRRPNTVGTRMWLPRWRRQVAWQGYHRCNCSSCHHSSRRPACCKDIAESNMCAPCFVALVVFDAFGKPREHPAIAIMHTHTVNPQTTSHSPSTPESSRVHELSARDYIDSFSAWAWLVCQQTLLNSRAFSCHKVCNRRSDRN